MWADIAERIVLDAGDIPQIVNEEKADLLVLGTCRPRRARTTGFGRNAQSSDSGELSGPRNSRELT